MKSTTTERLGARLIRMLWKDPEAFGFEACGQGSYGQECGRLAEFEAGSFAKDYAVESAGEHSLCRECAAAEYEADTHDYETEADRTRVLEAKAREGLARRSRDGAWYERWYLTGLKYDYDVGRQRVASLVGRAMGGRLRVKKAQFVTTHDSRSRR